MVKTFASEVVARTNSGLVGNTSTIRLCPSSTSSAPNRACPHYECNGLFSTGIIYSYENGFIPQAPGGSFLSFSQDQSLKRGSILRGNQHMNRAFHSVALAAALFLSTAFTSPATHQPSAATMTTQRF